MPLPVYNPEDGGNYIALGSTTEELSAGLEEYGKALSSSSSTWVNIDGNNSSLRRAFTQDDYDWARPEEALPTRHTDIMSASDRVYEEIGLIRNIIDLMSDFASRGIRISHPNLTNQNFYRNWFSRIKGVDRSERFLNNLYKYGNVIVQRRWAKLRKKDRQELKRSKAEQEQFEHVNPRRYRVPCRYTFLNPAVVEILGGALANFTGKRSYCIKLPHNLRNIITSPKNAIEEQLAKTLPEEIQKAARDKDACYILPPDDTLVFFYKKEDWQPWAKPIIFSILRDIRLLEKMKLTDFSALDSVIDHVRIYKLGSLDHRIAPAAGAVNKLRDMLYANHGAGVRSIVWGPDIQIEESKASMHEFLGTEKYEPILNAIYAGLGIPPTLTGTSDSGGTTNNLISIKTLIKRLDYGRQILVEFWNHELAIVQKAMGHREPAIIEFDNNNLGDEEAEKKLFLELADRDIISNEFVQQKFGAEMKLEQTRINREERERRSNKRTPKASPYHNPDWEKGIKKSLVDQGRVHPEQVGVELKEPGETNVLEDTELQDSPEDDNDETNDVTNPVGRPPNTKDLNPRKRRRFVPQIKAVEFWTSNAQDEIAKLVNPVILSHFNKKNMRSLSSTESHEAEIIKFITLCNITPLSKITKSVVYTALNTRSQGEFLSEYNQCVDETKKILGRELTCGELRNIQVEIYISGVYTSDQFK